MGILAAVFVILAITLIPAIRSKVNQQAEIEGLRERIAQQRETVAGLQREERQWSDPAYVEQQARQRLKFVRVGERSFTVIDGDGAPDLTGGAQIAAPAKSSATARTPWYGQLWQSMVIADTGAKVATGQSSQTPRSP